MPLGEPNLFGFHELDNKDSFFNGKPVLSQGVGYAIVCGYGTFFVVLTLVITHLDRKFGGARDTSEEFNTAGRSIKTGLVAVDVVSRWTWVATILLSATAAYHYGINGSFWFSTSSAVQLILFGILSTELKRKAPKAHTVIELVRRRWGNCAGFVFLYLCLINNVAVCALLIIGAGNVLAAGTGINIYVTLILLPAGVVIYTVSGGLKATFTSSYVHTVIIFVALEIYIYKIYGSSSGPLGSISKVWNNLNTYTSILPIKGNRGGSAMTMFSREGTIFAVWNFLASFGNIAADQAYWQGAIAAEPKAAFRGYILGALLWIPIPFAYGTAMGLAALALDLPISQGEIDQGLIAVATAQFILGTGGVVLILSVVFMSVTSAGSAEFMAMSSLFTYDIYKAYIRPTATSKELLLVSRSAVMVIGLLMGGISCLFNSIGINVNFLFFVTGLLVSSTVPTLSMMITWPAVSTGAAIAGALGGQICAVSAWLGHTKIVYGRLTVNDTLQRLGPTLDGTLVAIVSSAVICTVWTLLSPDDSQSFERFQEIELMDDLEIDDIKKDMPEDMLQFSRKYTIIAFFLVVLLLIIWPLLTLPAGVFSEEYFFFWIVVAITWSTVAAAVSIFMPLLEARVLLRKVLLIMCRRSVEEKIPGSSEGLVPG